MGDVQRVGDISEEGADLFGDAMFHIADGAEVDDHRKNKYHHDGFIEAVGPNVIPPTDPWQAENGDQQQTGEEKSIFTCFQRHHSAQQHTCHIGEEEAREAYAQLFRGERPATDEIARLVGQYEVEGCGCGDANQDEEDAVRQFSQDERVKNIGDVFQEERPCRAVERMHFGPALDVHRYGNGDQGISDEQYEQQLCHGGIGDIGEDV